MSFDETLLSCLYLLAVTRSANWQPNDTSNIDWQVTTTQRIIVICTN